MRTTRQDWLEAGLRILAQDGARALTIERLSGALGVTKGSFYHHFGGFGDYKRALLDFYEQVATQTIIDLTEQRDTATAKLRFLLALITSGTPDLEIGLRAWAQQDEDVRGAQARIDSRRIDYVRSLCLQIAPDPQRALLMGQMAYAILIGSAHILPALPQSALRAMYDEFLTLSGIDPQGGSDEANQ